jgi:hypothetical protein
MKRKLMQLFLKNHPIRLKDSSGYLKKSLGSAAMTCPTRSSKRAEEEAELGIQQKGWTSGITLVLRQVTFGGMVVIQTQHLREIVDWILTVCMYACRGMDGLKGHATGDRARTMVIRIGVRLL